MKLILIGELRLTDKAAVHQADLAQALDAEKITAWPKEGDVRVIMGKLLGSRKPAMLHRAEKNGATIEPLADVLTNDVRARLREVLAAKPKLETYERLALEWLGAADGTLPKPKRLKRKVAANG